MINRIKKISSLLIALVFMLTLMIGNKSVHASNNESGSITIRDTQKDKEYRLYKIFDLTHKEGNVTYSISNEWKNFFNDEGEDYISDDNFDDLNPIIVDGLTKYINITDYNVDEFAMKAFEYANKLDPYKSATGNGSDLTVSVGNDLGYYLIYPKGASEILEGQASIVSLTSTTPDAYVEIKATYPDIKKEADKVTAEMGEEINYTLRGKVPDTTGYKTYKYKLSDKLSKGLTLIKDSVKIYIGDVEFHLSFGSFLIDANSNNELSVTIDMQQLQDYIGDEVRVEYQAVLNEYAVIGKKGNDNNVTLEYSNDPKNAEETEITPPVIVKVYTTKIKILKIDGIYSSPLKDAKFVLKDEYGDYYKFNYDKNKVDWVSSKEEATEKITDSKGEVDFIGLKAGTYYLEETGAPAGFNKLTEDIRIEITEETIKTTDVIEIEVENNSGVELPDTGGKGKLLFATIGGAVIIIALFSIARDRLKRERN